MMKSLVMSLFLLTNCFGAILAFALVSVAEDPKLNWMYTGISAAAGACTILFWLCHHKRDEYDVEEDAIHRKQDEMDKYRGVEKEHEPGLEKDVK